MTSDDEEFSQRRVLTKTPGHSSGCYSMFPFTLETVETYIVDPQFEFNWVRNPGAICNAPSGETI